MCRQKSSILLCIFAVFLFNSCKEKSTSDIELRTYFTSYTQGLINADEVIEFRTINEINIDLSTLKNEIKTSPKFDYDLKISEDRKRLQLIPSNKFKRGETYTVEISLGKLFDSKAKGSLKTVLKIFKQHIEVEREGLVLDGNNTYLDLAVTTALDEDSNNIFDLFDYQKAKIKVNEISPREFDVQILFDPRAGKSFVKWSGKSIQAEENGLLKVWDFDADEFTVISSYYNKEEKEYKIYFTKPLDTKQDAKGLIQVGDQNAEYKIENNKIVVYINSNTKENVNLSINKGIKAKDGSALDTQLNYEIESLIVRPEVSWLDEGMYIPSDGIFKIPFKAKGLKTIEVSVVAIRSEEMSKFASWNNMTYMDRMELIRFGELTYQEQKNLDTDPSINLSKWNEFGLDFTEAFEREKGVLYHVMLNFGPSNTILSCENKLLYEFEQNVISAKTFDTKGYRYNYYGYYDYKEANNPCHISYYYNDNLITKNIHCTNVFPIIKKAGKEVHVALKDLRNTDLALGAQVSALSLQGKTLSQNTIQNGGIVVFKNLQREVQAIKIDYQGEISFFNIEAGTENNLTEFDISSNVRDVDNKLFAYTERDVWRPGDTIYLDVMLHRDRFDYPDDLPIVVQFKNPKGVLFKRYLQSINDNQHIYSFKMPTESEALTGYWSADISVGPLRKVKKLRVETIKPNVVDLTYQFDGEENNWVYNKQLKGTLDVQYLAGYPMSNGRVSSEANIYNVSRPFEDFRNYVFHPLKTKKPITGEKLWDTKTDKDGKANIRRGSDFTSFTSVVKVIIDTKIDLPSGGLNTETETRLISPYKSYVGINQKRGKGWRGSFVYGEKPIFDIIRVNEKGKLNRENIAVEVTISKYKEDWWYDRYSLSRDHSYRSSQKLEKIQTKKITLANGSGQYEHTDANLESGAYVLKVKDLTSGHIAEYSFHHITSENYTVKTTPEFFNIELEKEDFNIGESAQIKLPKLKTAKALVSIEAGEKVLDAFWIDLDQPNLELNIKEEWFPNFYIHTTIVQNYGQEENDRPLRMYTVKKINVNEPKRTLELSINSPDKVEPNKSFTIEISEQEGQACEYTLAVVDMGLLNLTGYQTPDPLLHFSKKLSLKVKTWDIFHKLIYYMNPSYAGILSIGGDGSLNNKQDESADFNRFEPVVYHIGPQKLNANGSNRHEIKLPNYIGKLKLMAIATNGRTFGSKSENVRVVSPLMVQSQLPRSLNITDKVKVPVSLFKDEQSINDVAISTSVSNSLLSFANQNINTSFGSENQKIETLEFTTGNESGTVEINLDARSNQYNFSEETKLFINYPNSYSDKIDYYQVNAGETIDIQVNSFGFEKTRNVGLNVSGALVPNFTKHYQDLIEYPYGCLEQTTSKAFALMYINKLVNLTAEEEHKREDILDGSILRIQSYQKSNGQFNYWRNGYYHSWSDLYAGHFLIDARDQNRLSKESVLKLWMTYHQGVANKWKMQSLSNDWVIQREALLQAYRLFLLAKGGKPSKSAMNRFKKLDVDSKMSKIFLAGAYYYAGMEDVGRSIFDTAISQSDSDQINRYTFGSSIRNNAIIVYIMSLFSDGEQLDRYYRDWVQKVNDARWTSTQDKGFAFMACQAYFGENQNIDTHIEYELKSNLINKVEKIPSQSNKKYHWEWNELADQVEVSNRGQSNLFICKTQRAISEELYQPADKSNLSMQVNYTNRQGRQVDLNNIKQGDEIIASVKIKNQDLIDQENLALTIKAASGWEIINPRLYSTNLDKEMSSYNYQDFRDDKVYTYFELLKNKEKEYTFRFKANLKGDYYLPAVFCENMYDGNTYARSKATRTQVK